MSSKCQEKLRAGCQGHVRPLRKPEGHRSDYFSSSAWLIISIPPRGASGGPEFASSGSGAGRDHRLRRQSGRKIPRWTYRFPPRLAAHEVVVWKMLLDMDRASGVWMSGFSQAEGLVGKLCSMHPSLQSWEWRSGRGSREESDMEGLA